MLGELAVTSMPGHYHSGALSLWLPPTLYDMSDEMAPIDG